LSCRGWLVATPPEPDISCRANPARRTAIGDKWTYALELEGRRVELGEGEATIGRSRSCTITLRDPSASRNHVLISVKPGEVRARDLQSSNGTYLNGERLTGERIVNEGDRITIGETDIVVRIEAPAREEVGATVRLDEAKLQCPACGAELPVHAEFCARCGHRLGGEAVASGTTVFETAGAPGPASAPALPPPPLPQGPARTEIYREAQPVAPAPPPSPAGISDRTLHEPLEVPGGGELLPSLEDEAFRTPPVPALPVTPSPSRSALPPPPRPAASPQPPVGGAVPAPAPGQAAGRFAGFWIRLAATLVDWLWITAVTVALTLPFGGPLKPNGSLVAAVASVLLWIVVPVLGWGIFGATPGKGLLGLRVIGGRRRRGLGIPLAFLRLCGMMVSGVLLGLGFLMIAFTRDKRGLHDHLAGTAVIRR
jgi:pSer/pThr/pTyr-binding forkhead associated (FHA) protein/uncharacterized RDD family membrane protein YckC